MREARSLKLLAALAALALACTLAPQAATASDGIRFEATRDGSASFAARVVTGASGELQAEIASSGSFKGGSTEGFAMLLYRADRSFWFGIGVTGSISGERTIVRLGAPDVDDASVTPELDGGSMRFTIGTTPGNSVFVVAWGAGLERVTFRVLGDADLALRVNEGSARALGDVELEGGSPNVQIQKNYALYQGVGVKVIRDARASLGASQALHAFFLHNNVKIVCQSGPGCVTPGTVDAACRLAAGASCDATRLSWSGPGGAGGAGAPSYTILNGAAGAYEFREDFKADAYATSGQYVAATGTLVLPYEDYTYLSAADVALPQS